MAMTEKVTAERNYSRFYAVLNRVPHVGEREELKRSLVNSVSLGRTDSLRELTDREYNTLCNTLERSLGEKPHRENSDLRRHRSQCLHLMQLWGVNTADWAAVDRFCLDRRIAGKKFRKIDMDGLDKLSNKLRAMQKKKGEE